MVEAEAPSQRMPRKNQVTSNGSSASKGLEQLHASSQSRIPAQTDTTIIREVRRVRSRNCQAIFRLLSMISSFLLNSSRLLSIAISKLACILPAISSTGVSIPTKPMNFPTFLLFILMRSLSLSPAYGFVLLARSVPSGWEGTIRMLKVFDRVHYVGDKIPFLLAETAIVTVGNFRSGRIGSAGVLGEKLFVPIHWRRVHVCPGTRCGLVVMVRYAVQLILGQ